MKIGILQTGRSPESIRAKHGDYNEFFERYLSGRGFTFENYEALEGELPQDPHDAQGWLITGSRFGVYEDHPWIKPLETFLQDAFKAGVPHIWRLFRSSNLGTSAWWEGRKIPRWLVSGYCIL